MASGGEQNSSILSDFEAWQNDTSSEAIFLLEPKPESDGRTKLVMLLAGEHEFNLYCPAGYPNHEEHYYVEAGPGITQWSNAVNEYLLDTTETLSLRSVLDKAVSLFGSSDVRRRSQSRTTDSEEDMSFEDEEEEEEVEEEPMGMSDDDRFFNTEWELQVARKKKRWAQKEQEVREELKRAKLGPTLSDLATLQATGQEKEAAKQIFTSCAASGILTNDLVKIMDPEMSMGFSADPVEDNIYQWSVMLYNFRADSELAKDLSQVKEKFGYEFIELQLDFAIDLYPFYPPLVKVIRPRLQGSLMQRVTNMEMLKLSYWNPAKDMQGVLSDIKNFLQHWARLEINSDRNDRKRYPYGSYVDIEHHLLRLALVSEVNPRANIKYHIDVEKPPEARPFSLAASKVLGISEEEFLKANDSKKKEEYWAAGTGYGHHNRPEWDVQAYLAAQKEKDKQVEAVLHKILAELKKLYANHAPQLKPRKPEAAAGSAAAAEAQSRQEEMECVDPVEDMYNILEGSALIPFLEQYLLADSFLEICRHTAVYKVILDIIKEISLQPQLVPLLASLPDQSQSIHLLLSALEKKANILLQHICKTGNGSIPKPPKKESGSSKKQKEGHRNADSKLAAAGDMQTTAEEKLAREFQSLYRDVIEAFKRVGLNPDQKPELDTPPELLDTGNLEIPLSTDQLEALETRYKKVMAELVFTSVDMEVNGSLVHNYAKEFKKQETLSQAQVFRIAQELTSLSSSLPLELSSSILCRTDDERLTLMKALITGPEGTPYSGGCFMFDIFFPTSYPHVPPMVNLQTTGGGSVRFNPNLYNCGKVCLSLLGTWEGQQGEQWNETTSTILQVLVSIQSLILVPEPYFNEPGYEQEIGTDAGKKHSAEYNLDVRINNIRYAMVAQLQNPSPGFEDVIRAHFYMKKDRVLQEVEGWIRRNKSSKLERAYQNLKTELQKLEPPPNLVNLCNKNSADSSANATPQATPQQTPAPERMSMGDSSSKQTDSSDKSTSDSESAV